MKIHFKILLVSLVFAGFYIAFNANEKDTHSQSKKASANKSDRAVHSLVSREENDVFCAILFMPKSYLPMLQRLAKHKLAQDIKIIPAKIDWHSDELIVLPKNPIAPKKSFQAETGTADQGSGNFATVTSAPGINAKIRAAAFLTFLASVKKLDSNRYSFSRNNHD